MGAQKESMNQNWMERAGGRTIQKKNPSFLLIFSVTRQLKLLVQEETLCQFYFAQKCLNFSK